MADFSNKRFVHLTHDPYGDDLYFASGDREETTSTYYMLSGSTATEAELLPYEGDTSNCNVIPPTAVVFVDFPDGTSAIVSHLRFYSKLDELGGGATQTFEGIRVLDTNNVPTFPTQSSEDLNIHAGDVCAVRSVDFSGSALTYFVIAVCIGATPTTDSSGCTTFQYGWQSVFTWPQPSEWDSLSTPLGS